MQEWNGIISLLFACIELVLLINVLIFAEKNRYNIIAAIIIFLLLTYQAVEYLMCGAGLQSSIFPYLAFADISLLPPFSVLLTLELKKSAIKKFSIIFFLPAISFIIYYAIVIDQFAVTSCSVLYAVYNYPLGDLYGFFYYSIFLISVFILISLLKSNDKKVKKISIILLSSSLFISLPVLTGFILKAFGSYSLLSMMESVMCKFALVYAICLAASTLINSRSMNERKAVQKNV